MHLSPKVIIVLVLLSLAVAIPFAKAFVLAYVYGVPVWYLLPNLVPLSVYSPERKMNVTVDPLVPYLLGDPVKVEVVDGLDGTALEDATVRVSKDGTEYAPGFTDGNGLMTFEYPGETTIIEVSKEGYQTVTKVIPRIPDLWIRTDFLQFVSNIITWIITLGASGVIIVKFRNEFKITVKHN